MASANAASAGEPAWERLVLFDGACGFCDRAVRWLLERDAHGVLRFAPLQGRTAEALRRRHAEIPRELGSIVYLEAGGDGERVYLRSDAALRIAAAIGVAPRLAGVVARLPRGLRDAAYSAFARIRYRVFGRLEACRTPTPEERVRFLD
jgi:predicted DCC family thiol-disulfide oxidoreductase YuxK